MTKHAIRRLTTGLVGLTAAAVALTACGSDNNSSSTSSGGSSSSSASSSPSAGSSGGTAGGANCAKGNILASGSTAQANAVSEWVKNYTGQCQGASVNYQGVGSGAGIQAFTQGSTAFAGSDSALKPEEHPKADARCKTGKAIDLPMVGGPIAVVYNLPGVKSLTVTPALLAKLFSGQVKKWDDPAVKAANSGASLPSVAVQPIHRSESSGTTDNFTKYLEKSAKDAWTYGHAKEWKAPGGQGVKGSDGIASAVKSSQGAVSYVEFSFAKNASLSYAKVDNGAGAVELTPESAGKAIGAAKVSGTGNDVALKLDYATKTPGAYPIVLVTYEITCEKGLPQEQLALVKGFLGYTSSEAGQGVLTNLGYAPIPAELRTKVQQAVSALS